MHNQRAAVSQVRKHLQAFIDGRKLITSAKGEALTDEQRGKLQAYATTIGTEWEKVLAEADRKGLSKRIAEPVWRELIDRCIEHEHIFWDLEHPPLAKKG